MKIKNLNINDKALKNKKKKFILKVASFLTAGTLIVTGGLFARQKIKEAKTNDNHIENVIGGKLDYMRMVVGDTNHAYKKLKARYNSLMGVKEDTSKTPTILIEAAITIATNMIKTK